MAVVDNPDGDDYQEYEFIHSSPNFGNALPCSPIILMRADFETVCAFLLALYFSYCFNLHK